MNRRTVTSGSPFEKTIGFSRAVRVNNIISVAGTAPILKNGATAHPDNLYLQTKHCFAVMTQAIEEAGGKLTDVIRTRIYLKDISLWEEAARAHGEIFSEIKPACTFVEVKGFIGKNWLVETELDCVIEEVIQSPNQ